MPDLTEQQKNDLVDLLSTGTDEEVEAYVNALPKELQGLASDFLLAIFIPPSQVDSPDMTSHDRLARFGDTGGTVFDTWTITSAKKAQ